MKKQLIPIVALFTITGTAHANEVNIQALQACTFVENDFNRLEAPLKIAEDAVVVDNGKLSIEEGFQKVLEIINC